MFLNGCFTQAFQMPTFYVTYELCSRGESQYLGSDSNSDDLQWQFTIVFIIFIILCFERGRLTVIIQTVVLMMQSVLFKKAVTKKKKHIRYCRCNLQRKPNRAFFTLIIGNAVTQPWKMKTLKTRNHLVSSNQADTAQCILWEMSACLELLIKTSWI